MIAGTHEMGLVVIDTKKMKIDHDYKHLFGDDYEWGNEKSNKIVLIGKDLDHQTIKNQLDCCRFNNNNN